MDPNATIKEIRKILELEDEANYDRLAELFSALDEWIVSGGFYPKDWTKGRV